LCAVNKEREREKERKKEKRKKEKRKKERKKERNAATGCNNAKRHVCSIWVSLSLTASSSY
jgi:hypothetical protein